MKIRLNTLEKAHKGEIIYEGRKERERKEKKEKSFLSRCA